MVDEYSTMKTVNERAIILEDVYAPFMITTVNLTELTEDAETPLETIIANTFNVPKYKVFDFDKWTRIADHLEKSDYDILRPDFRMPYIPDRQWHEDIKGVLERFAKDNSSKGTFIENCLKSIISNGMLHISRADFWSPSILPPLPLSRIQKYSNAPTITDEDISEWANITNMLLLDKPSRVETILDELTLYSMPLSQSPEIDWKTIKEVILNIPNVKNVCLFPLTYAAFYGTTNHLMHHEYVTGLILICMGGVYSLVLFGTVSLLQRLFPKMLGSSNRRRK